MRLDLNLLVVIEAVMLECNITRAAASLGMSQPAASNALARARLVTQDRLFIKGPGGVQPTARMLAIWPEMHQALGALRGLVAPGQFDPQTASGTFRLAITDSLAGWAVPAITLATAAASPGSRISFNFHTHAASLDAIERGLLDCAVGMFPSLPRTVRVLGLMIDRYVCVMRTGHHLSGALDLDGFVAGSHLLVTPSGREQGAVDGWLSLKGRRRNIVGVVNRFADAIEIVANSDLLTCVPAAMVASTQGIAIEELPFEAERLLYKLAWHERLDRHPAHKWFRYLIEQLCGEGASGAKSGLTHPELG